MWGSEDNYAEKREVLIGAYTIYISTGRGDNTKGRGVMNEAARIFKQLILVREKALLLRSRASKFHQSINFVKNVK